MTMTHDFLTFLIGAAAGGLLAACSIRVMRP